MITSPHPVVARIKEFADLRWPDRDLPGRLRKLGEEFGELSEAIARLCGMRPGLVDEEEHLNLLANMTMEVADVAIILQDILIVAGVEGDLLECMDAKMEVNERREWPVEVVTGVQQGPM